jgi:hypothetical protein
MTAACSGARLVSKWKENFEMAKANWFRGSALFVLGAILGGVFVASWEHSTAVAQNNPPVTQATLVADVTHLRDITPPNSHPMVDVAMFAVNL